MTLNLAEKYKVLTDNCKRICLLSTVFLLFACSSSNNPRSENIVNNPLATKTELVSSDEQDQALNLTPEIFSTIAQQFSLADDYIINGDYQAASQILNHFDASQLDIISKQNLLILQTKLALLEGNPKSALNWLKQIQVQTSDSIQQQIIIYQLKTQALYRTNQPFSSALSAIELNQLYQVNNTQNTDNLRIWQNLMNLEYSKIQYNYPHQTDTNIRDWLSLALIAKRYANNFKQLSTQLASWQDNHPNAAGNFLLDRLQLNRELHADTDLGDDVDTQGGADNNNSDIINNPNTPIESTQNLAILLPLSGKFASLGKAVQLGIIDSYYENQNNISNYSSNTPIIQLHFYDTNKFDSMSELNRKIIDDQNNLIIGPLTKQNVAKFANQYSGTIPMISLNYLANNQVSNFYQFGLSPSDEATQAAKLAWRLGKSKALIIAPDNQWGQAIKQSFIDKWEALGGNIVDNYDYKTSDKLADQLAKYLGIQDSKWRKYLIEKTIGQKTNSLAQRRKDIDMIFLVSQPATARQIKPLLKFYYANDIPVFATSSIYTGFAQAKTDQDLNGIYFCDTTWLINPTSTMKTKANKYKQLWGDDYVQFGRLHNLGADAYLLASQQQHLALLPDFPIVGASGNIFANNTNRLTRQLPCARFTNGIPKLVK